MATPRKMTVPALSRERSFARKMDSLHTGSTIKSEKEGEKKIVKSCLSVSKQPGSLFSSLFRCCIVYSGHGIRDDAKVALKFYKRGRTYEGALQREQHILDVLKEPEHNIGNINILALLDDEI